MFLNYIFHFLKGYVILITEGENTANFINICTNCGIRLDNIRFVRDNIYEMQMRTSDFKKLRPIARRTRTAVHIKKKISFVSFANRYKKRVFYVVGAAVCATTVIAASQFVWSVDVRGCENKTEILSAAELAGLRIGAYKHSLPDGNDMKNIILSNTNDVTWAWVYLKGTKAVVEVRKAIPPPQVVDRNTPCDIVAVRDGIIDDMLVKEGVALCNKGDVVLKGDVLIGGTYETKDGAYRLEHAIGEVSAITAHTAKRNVKLYKEIRKRTGRKKTYADVKVFSKDFQLYRNVNHGYENYTVEYKKRELKWGMEHYIGVEISENTYFEETVERVPIAAEEAVSAVKDEMYEEIAKELLPGSVRKSEDVSVKTIDDETVQITLTMQFIEKIGVPIELTYEKTE